MSEATSGTIAQCDKEEEATSIASSGKEGIDGDNQDGSRNPDVVNEEVLSLKRLASNVIENIKKLTK